MTVHEIDPNAEAKRAVVDALRDWLMRAEAGELRSVHVVAFETSGAAMRRESAGGYNIFEVVAALEFAKHGIIRGSFDDAGGT